MMLSNPSPGLALSAFTSRMGRPPELHELLSALLGPSSGTPADAVPQAGVPAGPAVTPAYDEDLSQDPRLLATDPGRVDPQALLWRLLWDQRPPQMPLWGGGFIPPSAPSTPGNILPAPGGGPMGGGIRDGGSVSVPSTASRQLRHRSKGLR